MNCVVTGRKIGDTSAARIAKDVVPRIGAATIGAVLIPA
jgi:hypothetical protein